MFKELIELIFPLSAEARIVADCTEQSIVASMHVHNAYHHIVALSHFSNPHIAALVHEAKFHRNKKAQQLLGKLLATYLLEYREESSVPVLIPIPLSTQRFRTRGYNQVENIVRAALEQGVYGGMNTAILKRVRDTLPQTSLNREKRVQNMEGAFVTLRPEYVSGQHLLIVDDVATTGATLCTAKDALTPHSPASITLIALAH